ncbi:FAD-dependent oxidoreductase [Paenibacillus sp. J5C_2022]|uniref:FAD-dependent oxidoreductase n=1 Tax=Paenibacillus sp. J5C2022 TaxID=2977129 RepID=UPI0021D1F950|nr:FAD-dependent oxidoreductase [Paenibacillus sp. J5C2022]MCU6712048.1 FAD-dependent oxidoreductase [Paenibacillus sp. J5C2022]
MTDFSQLYYYQRDDQSDEPNPVTADLCIYGGTPAGVAAAIQGRRMGLRVVIAEFSRNIGGITASGLGATDFGRKSAIGGIAREFYMKLGAMYDPQDGDGTSWHFAPSVAQNIFNEWLAQEDVPVYFEQHLASVESVSGKISAMTMENGQVFKARMFIDASYEGDLMARAGVSYTVGREGNSKYGETRNGIQFGSPYHMFNTRIDPYMIEGKPDSGLLSGIADIEPGVQGQGDHSIQAYNFRICLTDVPGNRVAFPEPPGYDPQQFELLSRYIRSGIWDAMRLHVRMPNGKTDLNNFGAVSTDYIGANHAWPDADYATREKLFQDHVRYNLGMLYFLANDDSVPAHVREEVGQWGLPADEFTDTANWPHQLYIREARRMVAEEVMTELHCRGLRVAEDSIGLASYMMDSHNCRRLVINGACVNEGDVEIKIEAPYPVSYRAIVPKGEQCQNLLVPVCLSASHIAYGSIRMEPVFMVLGQAAATAAAIALEEDRAVQDIEYGQLRECLLKDGQVL